MVKKPHLPDLLYVAYYFQLLETVSSIFPVKITLNMAYTQK